MSMSESARLSLKFARNALASDREEDKLRGLLALNCEHPGKGARMSSEAERQQGEAWGNSRS